MYPFAFWKPDDKKVNRENVSQIWKDLNSIFVTLLGWSWLIYTVAIVIISICAYFAYCERCRRSEVVRRRRIIQRAQERPPQKRRPNAAYRDHQIYRHIILSVAKYMRNPEGVGAFINHMDQVYPSQDAVGGAKQQLFLGELAVDEGGIAEDMAVAEN